MTAMSRRPVLPGFPLLAAALLAAASPITAFAAEPAQGDGVPAAPAFSATARGGSSASVDEITVTGSRIRRDNLSEFGPLTAVSSDELTLSGVSTVNEALRELPSVGFQAASRNNNNGGGGRVGVDLRDLGSARTLVLLNGRRFVSEDGAVDLNNIPVEMLERVEVLRDGASAVYGADAVSGVVNFVLNERYEGTKLSLNGGTTAQGDGETLGGSLTWGRSFLDSRLNVIASGTYNSRRPILQRDRRFGRGVVSAAFREKRGSERDLLDGSKDGVARIFGSSSTPEGVARLQGGDMTAFFRPAGGRSFQGFDSFDRKQTFDFGPEQFLNGEVNRFNGLLIANYAIRDELTAFAELSYTRRDDRQELAAQPLGQSTSRFPGGFEFQVFNPRSDAGRNNPFLPADFVDAAFRGEDGQIDPAAGPRRFTLDRRIVEAGNRMLRNKADTFRFVGGLRGDFTAQLLEGFSWEAYLNFGDTRTRDFTKNSINLERALQTLDPELCARKADQGCVVGNYFGAGSLQPQVVDYIRFTDRRRFGLRQRQVGASLTGPLLELPAGPLSIAVGAEYRKEDGFDRPGFEVLSGASAGNGSSGTAGDFIERDLFWEATVPLLSGRFLVEDLSLDLAGRLTDYSTFGSDYVYRYAVSYAPTQDLRLRTYYSTSFRAPRISDLFLAGQDAFLALADPCSNLAEQSDANIVANCTQQIGAAAQTFAQQGSQIRSNVGGNSEIQDEKSNYFGAGVVLTPRWLSGVSASVDYYDIEIKDFIGTPAAQRRLDDCYASADFDANPICAQRIARGPSGQISLFELALENLGKIETKGIDLDLRLDFGSRFGAASFEWINSYVMNFEVTDDLGKDQNNGKFEADGGSQPNYKSLFRTRFSPAGLEDRLTLRTSAQYIGEAENQAREDDVFDRVGREVYWNASLSYRFPSGLTWILGGDNLTDNEPPFVPGTGTNTQTNTYDLAGRRFFTRLDYEF
jgi:iron complex outermembrane receptor protein